MRCCLGLARDVSRPVFALMFGGRRAAGARETGNSEALPGRRPRVSTARIREFGQSRRPHRLTVGLLAA